MTTKRSGKINLQKTQLQAALPEVIPLKTAYGVSVVVPASLHCMTTYVLLEQEQWFEREVGFLLRWLRSGMNVIDVGANVGAYSLPLAHRVGKQGLVFAFEPGSKNRELLEAGRLANDLPNLEISPCALSDSEKHGWLRIGESGEVNFLDQDNSPADKGENVSVTTLDAQQRYHDWPSIDFVKVDAEGEEARIFVGGRDFFQRHSPLVMFEINDGTEQNNSLAMTLSPLGYDTYRLLGDASCLVPLERGEPLDFLELNLFAAKPDRAASLAERGFCITNIELFSLTAPEQERALESLLSQPYARSFGFSKADILECPYGEALIAYAAYRFLELPPNRRYSSLKQAFDVLCRFSCDAPTPSWAATLVRVALDLGRRRVAVDTLNRWHEMPVGEIDQPFFPPCLRYENLDPKDREAEWITAGFIEQIELSHSLSSLYSPDSLDRLQWLCKSHFSSAAISRRTVLSYARRGTRLNDLLCYIDSRHHHENPGYWSIAGLPKLLALLRPLPSL